MNWKEAVLQARWHFEDSWKPNDQYPGVFLGMRLAFWLINSMKGETTEDILRQIDERVQWARRAMYAGRTDDPVLDGMLAFFRYVKLSLELKEGRHEIKTLPTKL